MSSDAEGARARFEKQILGEAPRLGKDDCFRFACHPGVSCFGDCCGDVNIVLMPYDVLRLKNRLGITTTEFLDQYTVLPFSKEQRIPAPLLRMRDDEKKTCHFLEDGGCSVYEDRPWACRMYPLGFAKPGADTPGEKPFWFLIEEEQCHGFEEGDTLSVADWIRDQGIEEYDEWGELYRRLAVDDYLASGRNLEPGQMQMFFMGTYDLDTFRRFVFESTFLDRFDITDEEVEALRNEDEALMRFAFRWLEFSLFGKRTVKIRENADPERQS